MDPTEALEAHAAGHRKAASELLPLVYRQLRMLAERYLRRERAGHSLQPSDLVHEAYLRLVDTSRVSWQGKTHFFAVSARQMRRILVDHARARKAQRHGGGVRRLTLKESIVPSPGKPVDVLGLDEALTKLAALSPRQSRTVELRFFGGLTIPETACELGVSEETVKLDWRMAKVWLLRELGSAGEK
jgi:RNA polymerase sigma factor (TIGR02999 family)